MSSKQNRPLDTEIVFRQLSDSFEEMKKAWFDPYRVSRLFGEYVNLSQKLTEIMRKEFSHSTGRRWEASAFTGWTSVTELFKKLRRTDYHKSPVRLKVATMARAPATVIKPKAKENEWLFLQWEQELPSPFDSDMPKNWLDVSSVVVQGKTIAIEKIDYEIEYRTYVIDSDDAAIKAQLQDIGTHDIAELTVRCQITLDEYYQFYSTSLDSHKEL